MKSIKGIIKLFLPPVLFSFLGKQKEKPRAGGQLWSGDYTSWQEAQVHCTGYESNLILQKCKSALLKVKNGEAVYERDSILFDEIQYSWGLLAALEKAALENDGRLCVLDFGGSLGSTYCQNRDFLSSVKELQWCIVEQPHFVDCGKENFENEQLKFYHSIESCLAVHKPNAVVLSSVLQYLENPDEIINKILKLNVPYLILDRLSLSNEKRDILTVQNVPAQYYESKLGHWFFSYDKLISKFSDRYELVASSPSYADSPLVLNKSVNCFFKLLIFKKRNS